MFWHRREAPIFRKFKLWDSKQAWLWKIQVSEDWEYGLGLLFFGGIWTPFTSCTILAVKILIFPYSIQSYVATVGIYCFNLMFPYRWLFFDVLLDATPLFLTITLYSQMVGWIWHPVNDGRYGSLIYGYGVPHFIIQIFSSLLLQ